MTKRLKAFYMRYLMSGYVSGFHIKASVKPWDAHKEPLKGHWQDNPDWWKKGATAPGQKEWGHFVYAYAI